jgi:TPR repeat protein
LRNKNLAPSAEELKLLNGQPAITNGYFPALALVGGVPAGEALQKLLDSKDAKTRAAAAETGVYGIFDEATVSAIAAKANDPSPEVRRSVLRALATQANWRSEAAQQALVKLALDPAYGDRVSAVDGLVTAARLQIRGVRQDPKLFKALVMLLDDKDEELRTMASNFLAPVRDPGFRGDLGRPEQKTPEGGWQQWLDKVTTKAAGYRKDYEVCANRTAGQNEPIDLYCSGEKTMRTDPASAFQSTLKAAEQGYVPAQAAVGMMYADGKGTQQSYPEAAKWWNKAAEAGHVLAASNLSMIYRGGAGVPSDPKLSEKWAKFAAEHQ